MKIRVIAITAIIILAIAAASPAQPHAAGARILGKYLQLTPDQAGAWKQIHSDTAATIEPLAAQARELRKEIAAATNPDDIGKLTVSLREIGDQIRSARESAKTKLVATLTPEQKTKFEAFEAAMQFLKSARRR